MDFKNWFCLNQRESFTIDPKINPADARFYFGREPLEKRMKQQISRAFVDPQVPKMMVWGPYGCGKTQTLYHLAHWLLQNKPASCKEQPFVVHLDIEVQSKSNAQSWHLQNMEAIGMATVQQWLQEIFSKSPNFEQQLAVLTDDPNIHRAFSELRGGSFAAWRWLTGQKLSASDLEGIKVTRNLGDVGVGDFVSVLRACGSLARAAGNCLILMIDELEELINVREGDAAESWHQYARKLSENANSSVGFILGFKAVTFDEAPRSLIREDVRSRIGANAYIELDSLAAVANVQTFVKEMLAHLVDQTAANQRIQTKALTSTTETYPFTASAFQLLCDYACQDTLKSTPRNIIKTINECAIAAWDAQKQIIDDEIVNEIAPVVFG